MLASFLLWAGTQAVSHTQCAIAVRGMGSRRFLMLHFTYAFLGRPRDRVYRFFLSIAAVLLSALLISGIAAVARGSLGSVADSGSLVSHPIVIAPGVLLPAIYCAFAVLDVRRTRSDPAARGHLSLILTAILLTFVVGPTFDVIIPWVSERHGYESAETLSIIAFSVCGETIWVCSARDREGGPRSEIPGPSAETGVRTDAGTRLRQ